MLGVLDPPHEARTSHKISFATHLAKMFLLHYELETEYFDQFPSRLMQSFFYSFPKRNAKSLHDPFRAETVCNS